RIRWLGTREHQARVVPVARPHTASTFARPKTPARLSTTGIRVAVARPQCAACSHIGRNCSAGTVVSSARIAAKSSLPRAAERRRSLLTSIVPPTAIAMTNNPRAHQPHQPEGGRCRPQAHRTPVDRGLDPVEGDLLALRAHVYVGIVARALCWLHGCS